MSSWALFPQKRAVKALAKVQALRTWPSLSKTIFIVDKLPLPSIHLRGDQQEHQLARSQLTPLPSRLIFITRKSTRETPQIHNHGCSSTEHWHQGRRNLLSQPGSSHNSATLPLDPPRAPSRPLGTTVTDTQFCPVVCRANRVGEVRWCQHWKVHHWSRPDQDGLLR